MEEIGIKDVMRVVDAIFVSTGIDFSNYAFSSFRRRIIRFVEINKTRDLNIFIEMIKTNKDFADNLVKEITVNVTEMFRDPSFWIVLRDNILPQISNKREINIWHAACSTGEEVFSMAIALKESGLLHKSRIVATDINEDVLKIAEKGVFHFKNHEINNKNYELFNPNGNLLNYCTIDDNNVLFNKQLISNVTFKRHNLVQDGPFSKFDIILCRNVLIYFNFDLQEKVITTFGKSMEEGAFLGIGTKESIHWCKGSKFFEAENLEEKFYRKVIDKEHYHFMSA